MEKVKLYHFPPSFYSQIVRLTLEEKGVSWEGQHVNIGPMLENYQPWYVRINNKGVVPTLEHNGKIITSSFEIIKYIDSNFPGPSLTPDTEESRRKMEEWLTALKEFPSREYAYGNIRGVMKLFIKHSYSLRRKVLKKHLQEHPELSSFYEHRLKDVEKWQSVVENSQKMKELHTSLEKLFDRLEADLQDGREFVIDGKYSLVDVVWTVFIARSIMMKDEKLWQGSRPKVAAYCQRLLSRPSYKKADVWDHLQREVMFPIIARFVIPRMLLLFTALGVPLSLIWFFVDYFGS